MHRLKVRFVRIILSVALLLFAAGLYLRIFPPPAKDGLSDTIPSAAGVAGMKIGGPYSLIDHTGEIVSEKDFNDKFKLIYFGFTYCPAVCPTELQKISAALESLEKKGMNVQKFIYPLFITVDPVRDTVQKLKEYVAFFHPALIGLTGSEEDIKHVLRLYKIYAAPVYTEDASDYTMDHSSFIYFMSPDDRILSIFRSDDEAEKMADEIYRKIRGQTVQ